MRNLSTWLLVMFMVMFWGFRVIVTLMSQLGKDLSGIVPLDFNIEIILLFFTLVCMIFIVKRKMIGSLLYLASYGIYFGIDLFNRIGSIIEDETAPIEVYANGFFAFLGIILPLAVLLDLLADRNRKANPKDKKTDWFYKNEQYDRKLDDRADKNNYRTM